MSFLVKRPAPDFSAEGVVNGKIGEISIKDFKGKFLVLLFYPLDL
jgi:peroxiredoxin 2/4